MAVFLALLAEFACVVEDVALEALVDAFLLVSVDCGSEADLFLARSNIVDATESFCVGRTC
ncbi:MAG: hypothetical protein AB8C02_06980 [Halioglobus sp.]